MRWSGAWAVDMDRRYGAGLESERAALVQSGPLDERADKTAVRDGDASSGSTDALGPD